MVIQISAIFLIGCNEGDVRLVDGRNVHEGRVEVCRNNAWGQVCSTAWTHYDARVVCRQLGFTSTGKLLSLYSYSYYT